MQPARRRTRMRSPKNHFIMHTRRRGCPQEGASSITRRGPGDDVCIELVADHRHAGSKVLSADIIMCVSCNGLCAQLLADHRHAGSVTLSDGILFCRAGDDGQDWPCVRLGHRETVWPALHASTLRFAQQQSCVLAVLLDWLVACLYSELFAATIYLLVVLLDWLVLDKPMFDGARICSIIWLGGDYARGCPHTALHRCCFRWHG